MLIKQGKYALVAGYVPRDAEVRTTPNGHDVCNFSVKATETTDESGNKTVNWLNCVAWRKACDAARYITKGDTVLCAGEMMQRSYTTREGEPRTVTELVCDFVMPMQSNAMAPMFPDVIPDKASTPSAPAFAELEDVVDDDLPF